MRIYLTSLGCKLNQSEVESWARGLAGLGCAVVQDPRQADLCIVNTCTVTHVAARKSRQMIRRCARARGLEPFPEVVVTGCYAQVQRQEAAALPGVRVVLGMAEKEQLVQRIAEHYGLARTSVDDVTHLIPSLHTRALVKIQDGCDNACSYCIVRIARGGQRSRSVQDIVGEVLAREAEGYREVVLTGVHIGAYGRERGQTLGELVRSILIRTHLARLRLSSLEPWDVTPELLALWESPRLCRHLHLPLQSGSDATLQRMNRRYTAAQYRDLVDRARGLIPDLAVTTDVIVGFPGEDAGEHSESSDFVASLRLARVHVFPFSPRPGTAAAAMGGQVEAAVMKERVRHMCAVAHENAVAFRRRFVGRTMEVLWESADCGEWSGLTDNYLRVVAPSSADLHNRIVATRLLALTEGGLRGELA